MRLLKNSSRPSLGLLDSVVPPCIYLSGWRWDFDGGPVPEWSSGWPTSIGFPSFFNPQLQKEI